MLPIGHVIAERSVHIRDLDPGSGLPDADQPLRFVKGKRPEQDAVDDAENSRVRADSQPKRDKRGQRKSRRSRETAKRILQVTDRIHRWAIPPAHSSAGPIKRPLEDTKNPVFKILSATKLHSIDLYAQTPADERKKSNPRQKLRENHWEDRSLSVGRRDSSLLNLLLFPPRLIFYFLEVPSWIQLFPQTCSNFC